MCTVFYLKNSGLLSKNRDKEKAEVEGNETFEQRHYEQASKTLQPVNGNRTDLRANERNE